MHKAPVLKDTAVNGYPDYDQSPMAIISLEPILAKLCHPTRGLNWDVDRARKATEQYRRWLWLNAKYEVAGLTPSPDVDQVWHAHILDTRKYVQDCAVMFDGRFLHHNPYAGWENEEAEVEHQAKYRHTQALFKLHFDVSLVGETGLCVSSYDDGEIWRPGVQVRIAA